MGKVWTGVLVSSNHNQVILSNPRPFHAGLFKGSSDLIGWNSIEITEEMIGARVAVFTAVEIKTKGVKTTTEQSRFIDAVNNAGGIAGIVYNENEALKLIKDKTWR